MLVDALLESTARFGRRLAVADQQMKLSYRRLTAAAAALGDLIGRATANQRVGIMLPASAAFPATLFGALWAGRIAVPLNFLMSADELKFIVADAGLDTVISVHHFDKLLGELPVRNIALEDVGLKRKVLWRTFRRTPSAPRVTSADTAVLLYTSGTAAAPKGVELTQANLRNNCDACIEAARMDPRNTFLNILPPFHVFGLTANVLVPVVLGAGVYARPRFQPAAALRAVRQHRISIMLAIPSMYAAMLHAKSVPDDALASITLAISGGEPLPEPVAQGFEQRFGVRLHQGYGLTETSPVVSLCASHAYQEGSVGRILPGLECRITDDDGRKLPPNRDGEIQVRGHCVMKGYHNQPEQTAAATDPDGWFRTGDVGRLDHDGFLYITGRKKEMIIVGGENVAPAEIETVLIQHPAVAEAAVIGVPDKSRGEAPVAFVTLTDGADTDTLTEQDLRTFTRQHLAGHKVPRRVKIAPDLPRGPTGKILKRKLGELLEET